MRGNAKRPWTSPTPYPAEHSTRRAGDPASQIHASPAALAYINLCRQWRTDEGRPSGEAHGEHDRIAGWREAARCSGVLAAAILCLAPGLGWAADDPRDAAFLEPVLQRVLETARTDVEIPWRNPATGNGGSIVVERTFYREPEMPCRAFARTLESAGAAPQVTRGTGCRSSTGLWLIEEEPESLAGSAPRGAAARRAGHGRRAAA